MTRRTRLVLGVIGLLLIIAAGLALGYAFSAHTLNSGVYALTPTFLVPPIGTPGPVP